MHRKIRVVLACIAFWMCSIYLLVRYCEKQLHPPRLPTPKFVPDDIPYVINNEMTCNDEGSEITAVMLVTSHAGNLKQRQNLRRIYPSDELRRLGIRRVFLLGIALPDVRDRYTFHYNNLVPQTEILSENEEHADLVQGNFTEAYTFLTVKIVMGLRWVVNYCKNARFIVKMDDDWIVDIYRLLVALKSSGLEDAARIMGYTKLLNSPIRRMGDKFYVPPEEYSPKYYPKYVVGCLYATTPRTAAAMLEFTGVVPYLRFEDVFVTGVLGDFADVEFIPICWETMEFNGEMETCVLLDALKKIDCKFLVGSIAGLHFSLIMLIKEHFEYCHNHICRESDSLHICTRS